MKHEQELTLDAAERLGVQLHAEAVRAPRAAWTSGTIVLLGREIARLAQAVRKLERARDEAFLEAEGVCFGQAEALRQAAEFTPAGDEASDAHRAELFAQATGIDRALARLRKVRRNEGELERAIVDSE